MSYFQYEDRTQLSWTTKRQMERAGATTNSSVPLPEESFTYTRHHSNGWDCTIVCSAVQRGCLSSNTPWLQHHVLPPAQPQEVLSINRRYVYKEFVASSSM